MLCNEKPPQGEARAPRLENSPHLLQLGESPGNSKDPAQPKINEVVK